MYRRGQSPRLSTLCGFGRPNADRRIVIPEGNRMPSRKGRGDLRVSLAKSFLSSAVDVRFVGVWWARSHGLPKLLEGPTQIREEEKRVQGGTLEGRGGSEIERRTGARTDHVDGKVRESKGRKRRMGDGGRMSKEESDDVRHVRELRDPWRRCLPRRRAVRSDPRTVGGPTPTRRRSSNEWKPPRPLLPR